MGTVQSMQCIQRALVGSACSRVLPSSSIAAMLFYRNKTRIKPQSTSLSLNSLEINRTPDGLENEFVTIITITTLLITASLSLTSSIDDEELELYCENGCFASASIWFLLYLSTWSSGYGFLISFTLLIAFKSKNILPSDLETGNLFFEQYRHCLLYTSPSPRDATLSRMPSSA